MYSAETQLQTPKRIQHYQLTSAIYTTPFAEFWNANHQILKKQFVVKKIKINHPNFKNISIDLDSDQIFELAKSQTKLLQSIQNEAAPKCHKLIRTTTTSYIIYDCFPGQSLSSYLQEETLSTQDLSTLMLNIVKNLKKFHQEGITFLMLTFQSVFVSKDKKVMFTDCTLINKKGSFLQNDSELIGLVKATFNGIWPDFKRREEIDIYCLGRIFEKMMETQEKASLLSNQIKNLISKMTSLKQDTLIDLVTLIKELQTRQPSLKLDNIGTPTFKRYHVDYEVRKTDRSQLKLKKIKSQVTVLKTDDISVPKVYQKNLFKLNSTKSTSLDSIRESQNLLMSKKRLITRVILKKRSFGNFLLNMSAQIVDLNPFLSFLFLKKTKSCLLLASSELEKLKQEQNIYSETFKILKSEINNIDRLLLKMKKELIVFNLTDSQDNNFNCEKDVRNTIVMTIKDNVKILTNEKKSFSELSEIYFQLYVLSKIIEEESLQFFWEKTFQTGKEGQLLNFFKSQRMLGLRYFKKKIEQTIEKIT